MGRPKLRSLGRWRWLALFVLVAPAGAGCGGAAPKAKSAHSPRPSVALSTGNAAHASAPEKDPRERAELTRLPTGLPLIRVRVRGHTTLALFDTGSTAHVVSRQFLKTIDAKVETSANEAVDHNGKLFRLQRVRAPMRIEGFLRDERAPVYVADLPKALHDLGVGAVVSPSLLASGGERLEIDLLAGTAIRVKAGKGEHGESTRTEKLCTDESGGTLHGVTAMIGAPSDALLVRLLVDSGADRSDLFKDGPRAKTLGPRATSSRRATVATGEARARTVEDIDLRLGVWSWKLDLDLIAGASDPSCPRDGVLGMDALKRCRLAYQSDELTVSCAEK